MTPTPKKADLVRSATPADLTYLLHIQNKQTDSIGYVNKGALLERINTGRILVLTHNGDPAGYLNYTHRRDRITHLNQVAVSEELWRIGLGTLAMHQLIENARRCGSLMLHCRTAIDLPANRFWPTLGMRPGPLIPGQRRVLIPWKKRLGRKWLDPSSIHQRRNDGTMLSLEGRPTDG